jgi:hypothetical protein
MMFNSVGTNEGFPTYVAIKVRNSYSLDRGLTSEYSRSLSMFKSLTLEQGTVFDVTGNDKYGKGGSYHGK